MGRIIVVSGPEKVGKSTLCGALASAWMDAGQGFASIRHWGPIASDLEYLEALRSDVAKPTRDLTIWDRSWVCDHVYGRLLGRGNRLATDPWLGEWLYGRTVSSSVVVLPADVSTLQFLRDDTDLPVDPVAESLAYNHYALRFGLPIVVNDHQPETLRRNVSQILGSDAVVNPWTDPPRWVTTPARDVIFVGEQRNERSTYPGAWLPFTTRYTTEFARTLGANAPRCSWANAFDCPVDVAARHHLVVACGKEAGTWARYHVGHRNVVAVPHPAYLYRWGKASGKVDDVTTQVRDAIRPYMSTMVGTPA